MPIITKDFMYALDNQWISFSDILTSIGAVLDDSIEYQILVRGGTSVCCTELPTGETPNDKTVYLLRDSSGSLIYSVKEGYELWLRSLVNSKLIILTN
jgi:hypothetical protein